MTRTTRAAAVALVVIGLVGATTGAVLRADDTGTASSGRVEAVFADASPLRAGNEVKMYGVEVGLVDEVRLDPPGPQGRRLARVVMDVDPSARQLHADAAAAIRPVSLLGERYLDLTPGTPQAPPLGDPAVIGPEHTSRAVDVDDVLDTFDDPTSAALAAMVTTLGEGLRGRGPQVAAALDALAPALRRTDQLTAVLHQQNDALDHMIDDGSRVSAGLADHDGATLDELVDTTKQTLDATAANRQALDATLVALPDTVASVRRTLGQLAGTADATTPVLRSIRPVTSDLTTLSRELQDFSDAADPALGSLPPVLDRLDALLDQARPLVGDLQPAAHDLHSVTGSVRPIGQALLEHPRGVPSHLEDFMSGIADWAMATNGYDGASHYFRGVAVTTPQTICHAGAGLFPAGAVPDPLCTTAGAAVPAAPGLPTLLPGGAPAPAAPAPAGTSDNATGLTPAQEQGLVGQMLGGGR
ncbi:MlaD family protein [Actinomycetospora sp. TBRC 11914]|uniref:MlaD family protein n=1 Tax=Actinomycetospora sp. TBRC 11914 TaxID=2729387 RepID=UPI00145E1D91|nr:MlaD family protein [Actinomycetospora sp. TBRC 11914]NMO91478.1 MCE family protein [Actinomycetospora sp. TBRC 11914]